jgi:hypothetical protein
LFDTAYTAVYRSACKLLPQRCGIHTSLLPEMLQPGQLMLAAAAAAGMPLLSRCTDAHDAAGAELQNEFTGSRAGISNVKGFTDTPTASCLV